MRLNILALAAYAVLHYAEYTIKFIMLSVFWLNLDVLSVIMPTNLS